MPLSQSVIQYGTKHYICKERVMVSNRSCVQSFYRYGVKEYLKQDLDLQIVRLSKVMVHAIIMMKCVRSTQCMLIAL